MSINKELKYNICRITCNGEQGTGFLISKNLVLTVLHVIDENNEYPIEVVFPSTKRKAIYKPSDIKYRKLDIAILELEKEVDFYSNRSINFENIELQQKEIWKTRGYPKTGGRDGKNFIDDGNYIIEQKTLEKDSKIDIELEVAKRYDSYGGLSGSPLIVDDRVVGIINTELEENGIAKELTDLSYKYFKELIDEVTKVDTLVKKDAIDIIKNGKILGEITIETVNVPIEGKDYNLDVSVYPVKLSDYDIFCEETSRVQNKINSYIKENRKFNPLVKMTLEKANEYCRWLSDESDEKYRLLSSSEWEAIAKKDIPKSDFDDYIWHDKNSDAVSKIGMKKSGRLGLYDLFGNIEEICSNEVTKGCSFSCTLDSILKY